MQLFKSNKGYSVGEAYELDGEIVPASMIKEVDRIVKAKRN